MANFIQHRIRIVLIGPEETPYTGQEFEIEFDFPDKYPEVPFECYINQDIYHVNIWQNPENDSPKSRKNNRIMVKSLTKENWDSKVSNIFSVLLDILNIFKVPDTSEQFFPENELNQKAFDLYQSNERKYFKKVEK